MNMPPSQITRLTTMATRGNSAYSISAHGTDTPAADAHATSAPNESTAPQNATPYGSGLSAPSVFVGRPTAPRTMSFRWSRAAHKVAPANTR